MLKKNTLTIVVAVALILVLGIAACAQLHPTATRVPRNKAGAPNVQQQGAGGNMPGWQAREHRGAFAPLQRILMPPGMRDLEKMGLALNLTEEQKTSIKALYKAFGDKMKAIAPSRGAAVKSVLEALQSPNPSKGDLMSRAENVIQGDRAILDAEFDFWIGLKGILNTQQQAQVNAFMMEKAQKELGPPPGAPVGPPPPQQ